MPTTANDCSWALAAFFSLHGSRSYSKKARSPKKRRLTIDTSSTQHSRYFQCSHVVPLTHRAVPAVGTHRRGDKSLATIPTARFRPGMSPHLNFDHGFGFRRHCTRQGSARVLAGVGLRCRAVATTRHLSRPPYLLGTSSKLLESRYSSEHRCQLALSVLLLCIYFKATPRC